MTAETKLSVKELEKNIIVIKNLSKHFGSVKAVQNVDLTVKSGEVIVIVGPSGSGKSTLLRCINHLEHPTNGDIWIDGVHLNDHNTNINTVRAEVGMVFQQFNLFPHLTVLENVKLAQKTVRKRSDAEAEKIAREQLEIVGIPEQAEKFPSQLSGGQQQRVAIARALVGQPRLILADEPTGNLDSHTSDSIVELIEELNAEGATILVITHDHEIAAHFPRTVSLRDGLIESDSARMPGGRR